MQAILYTLILLLGVSSYAVGIERMLKGKYAPSVFSRVVWLMLAFNSFAAVLLSNGSQASILLASIFLVGNLAMCITSFWKGSKNFGSLESVCLILLMISVIIWIFFNAPLVNLGISLFAHLVGGMPTLKRAWDNPANENIAFWVLFFMASLLSIFASNGSSVTAIIFPLYYVLFDGIMFSLSATNRLGLYRLKRI